jgi:peptidoglycan/LPS O-acetylase OafA/YrhL
MTTPKVNNFDLIRLAAALQVAFSHAIADFGGVAPAWWVKSITDLFPGVPIFFFISGFLISKSFEKNSILKEYALNRFLRIYPGMAVCFLVSLVSVWLSGYFRTASVSLSALVLWAAAQLSIVQFYNPEFMRHYGVGVLNGSMWTITVELQFYILVPLLYAALRLRDMSRRHTNAALVALVLAFMIANQLFVHAAADHGKAFWYKLVGVSFAPWLYMFLIGVFVQRNFELILPMLQRRSVALIAGYFVLALIGERVLGWGFGNNLNPLQFMALSAVTFAVAFSAVTTSDRVLRRNDLSYGVYVYHAPVINLLLATRVAGGLGAVLLVIGASLALAYASWRLVEKPALGLKRHPLYQHTPANAAS